MTLDRILELVEQEKAKRGHVWYVDIPYMNGMFLERLSILTPEGKKALQQFKNIMDFKSYTEEEE